MAGGKEHYEAWKDWSWVSLVAAIVEIILLWWWFGQPYAWAGLLVPWGYFLGRWIDPDLDLVGISSSESRMMDDFKFAGVLSVMYWLPYAYVMRFVGWGRRGHRNFFSHSPVGTLIRFLYMVAPFFATYFYLYGFVLPVIVYVGCGTLLSGLMLADMVHYYKDR